MRFILLKELLLVCLLIALLGNTGCRKEAAKNTITGTVTYQDKPLLFGTVVLVGEDNLPRQGAIRVDGTYTVTDVPLGAVKIAVFSPDPKMRESKRTIQPPKIKEPSSPLHSATPEAPAMDVAKWFPIPDHYNNPETSNLNTTIEESMTRFDIHLKQKP